MWSHFKQGIRIIKTKAALRVKRKKKGYNFKKVFHVVHEREHSNIITIVVYGGQASYIFKFHTVQ